MNLRPRTSKRFITRIWLIYYWGWIKESEVFRVGNQEKKIKGMLEPHEHRLKLVVHRQ